MVLSIMDVGFFKYLRSDVLYPYILKRIIKEIYQKNTPSPDTKPAPGLKLMKSVYLKTIYKGNLLKKHPQPRYETGPRLENHEICIC